VIGLLSQTGFGGKRIHDLALAATMLANGVSRIYTYDQEHFSRIPGIQVLTP
jgi:predicted nucleic acid-binding protein